MSCDIQVATKRAWFWGKNSSLLKRSFFFSLNWVFNKQNGRTFESQSQLSHDWKTSHDNVSRQAICLHLNPQLTYAPLKFCEPPIRRVAHSHGKLKARDQGARHYQRKSNMASNMNRIVFIRGLRLAFKVTTLQFVQDYTGFSRFRRLTRFKFIRDDG